MIKEYQLDERANKFVSEALDCGKYLSFEVRKYIEKSGLSLDVVALLPSGTTEKQMYEFDFGGKTAMSLTEEKMIKFIVNYSDENAFLIIQDPLSYSSDDYIKNSDLEFFTIGQWQDVYWSALGEELSNNNVIETVFRTANKYRFLAFLGKLDEIKKLNKNNISEHMAEQICSALEFIIVGAYDEESFLIAEIKK